MRFVRKVGQRGIMTLPVELREVMEIQDGDIVEFEILGVVRRVPAVPSAEPVATLKEAHA
ncbi:MAG: AbrB/MazE/SpoVT family DNA-binding domain-containing protein [Candidatus Thermoplasmatota archaeon]